jgi:hypothetical protein
VGSLAAYWSGASNSSSEGCRSYIVAKLSDSHAKFVYVGAGAISRYSAVLLSLRLGRNVTTRRSEMLTSTPVFGLRPDRDVLSRK